MWKDYSSGYIKNNRSSSLSVMTAAFISALFLSLLCGLFYNAWKYETERIVQEEGGWHSRIMGEFTQEDAVTVQNFASVKDAVINRDEKKGTARAIDIYFEDMHAVFKDTPRIAGKIGAGPQQTVYHYGLLAMYLLRDSKDTAPRLLLPLFLMIVSAASLSLTVIIHNAFAVSMNARIHQFGIFSSIGASPKQIRACLLQEAAVLCSVPVIAGNLCGIAGSMGILQMINVLLGSGIEGRHRAVFGYHPLVLALTLSVTVLTIWISAWLPAAKISRMTPLEAIRNTGELQLKRRRHSRLLKMMFGVEGELAGNALKAQRKALRTASLSLSAAFLAFTLMQCFFTLSAISTRETYFERYQGVWDIMVTVQNTQADAFEKTDAVRGLAGIKSAIVYQKAAASRMITEEEMSGEMKSFGGFSHASSQYVTKTDGGWLVNAPVIILDDDSFLAYCEQAGVTPGLDGAVIFNRIRDVTNPDFRHPDWMPYIKEEGMDSVLRKAGSEEGMTAQIPVLGYTETVPLLREEYKTLDYYELVHFVPVSLWKEIKGRIGGTEEDSYICVRCGENPTLQDLNALEGEIRRTVSGTYTITCENRIREYETNQKQIQGMMAVFGGFCVLLAITGIGSVFSNTLGFVRQRRREFARYLSVGMTMAGLRKMFCIEALALAVRPVLVTLPLAVPVTAYMLKAGYIGTGEFLAEAPFVPVILFLSAVLAAVALAYYSAWRSVRKISLAEVLKDDTMM